MVEPLARDGGAAAPSPQRALDALAAERHLRRLEAAAQAPWLHVEVARRMAGRLALIKRAPEVVVDWWSHLGGSHEALRRAYPGARIVAVERAGAAGDRCAPAPAWWSPRRWRAAPAATVRQADDLGEAQAQLLWSNMGLHHMVDPAGTIARWLRALAVDGFLMFSTLGPGTLAALRALFHAQRWGPPHAPFVDMHDLGDMLVHAGFADPVMDQETITLNWSTPAALLAELRQLGGNTDPGRAAGLATPRWRARLERALAARALPDGRVALEFEIVYGHAFKPPPRARAGARTEVALEDMRRMLRARGAAR